jgi:hypothetical protein
VTVHATVTLLTQRIKNVWRIVAECFKAARVEAVATKSLALANRLRELLKARRIKRAPKAVSKRKVYRSESRWMERIERRLDVVFKVLKVALAMVALGHASAGCVPGCGRSALVLPGDSQSGPATTASPANGDPRHTATPAAGLVPQADVLHTPAAQSLPGG